MYFSRQWGRIAHKTQSRQRRQEFLLWLPQMSKKSQYQNTRLDISRRTKLTNALLTVDKGLETMSEKRRTNTNNAPYENKKPNMFLFRVIHWLLSSAKQQIRESVWPRTSNCKCLWAYDKAAGDGKVAGVISTRKKLRQGEKGRAIILQVVNQSAN